MKPTRRPHILILTADGMRYDALASNGNALARSPRLDELAKQGISFDRAYCSQPLCMPCRSSIMTGRYPSAHGVWQNGITLDESEILLPELLRHAGYKTHCYGKFHFQPWLQGLTPDENAHQCEYRGDGPYYGFEHVRVMDHSNEDRYHAWVKQHFPQHAQLARSPRSDPQYDPAGCNIAWKSSLPAQATKSSYVAQLSIDAIAAHDAEQPLLLWSSFIDPHHPFNPPVPYCDWFDEVDFPPPPSVEGTSGDLPAHYHAWVKRLREHWGHTDTAQKHWQTLRRMYQGKVAHVDAQIGRVLDAARQSPLWDDMIVLFMSDHGTMLGDYGLVQIGEYSQEALVHIPMIWRLPGTPSITRTDALASVVDVLPTLLDHAGLTSPLGVQGRSLRPVMEGSQTKVRDQLHVENRWGQDPPMGMVTLVTERYKLSVCSHPNEGELYDLRDDPQEVHNRFNQPQWRTIKLELMHRLVMENLCQSDPLPRRTGCW